MMVDMSNYKTNDYMMRVEAARFLGIHQNTLRNWEKSGKLLAYIHPITRYRLYKKEDLQKFLSTAEEN